MWHIVPPYAANESGPHNHLTEGLLVLSGAPAVVKTEREREKQKQAWVPSLPESEARPESGEVAAAGLARGRLAQTEEGVALHGALPQVLAALGAGQLEDEGVLLLPAL